MWFSPTYPRWTRYSRRLAPVFGCRRNSFTNGFTQQWRGWQRSLWNLDCWVDGRFTPNCLRWNCITKYLFWIWKWELWVSSSNPGEDMWWPCGARQNILCLPSEISQRYYVLLGLLCYGLKLTFNKCAKNVNNKGCVITSYFFAGF